MRVTFDKAKWMLDGDGAWLMIQADRQSISQFCKGKTQTIAQWSRETGLSANLIVRRINRLKWSPERALTERAIVGKNQYMHKGARQ